MTTKPFDADPRKKQTRMPHIIKRQSLNLALNLVDMAHHCHAQYFHLHTSKFNHTRAWMW